MEEIKEFKKGDLIRYKGNIYKLKDVGESHYIVSAGVKTIFINMEFIKDDLGESLADLIKRGDIWMKPDEPKYNFSTLAIRDEFVKDLNKALERDKWKRRR